MPEYFIKSLGHLTSTAQDVFNTCMNNEYYNSQPTDLCQHGMCENQTWIKKSNTS